MIVRSAREGDVSALLSLEREAFGPTAWREASIRVELTGVPASRYVVVAEADGVVVGYAVLMVVAETADVLRVVVATGHRCQGIGGSLMSELLAAAQRRGCATALLEVAADNGTARRLYAEMGFSVIDARRDYYGPGRDALIMSCTLSARRPPAATVSPVRDLTYPPVVLAVKAAFKALDLHVTMRGTEHIPTSGGAVLAVNHISYIDFIVSGYASLPSRRRVRFMAKKELFDHRVSGPIMRSLHHIEVDRGSGLASYATALDYLRRGEVIGIFPEATISRSFELKEFKSGVVRMAAEAGVPVVPVILWGTQRLYTKDHPRDFSRGKTVAVTVGEPFAPPRGANLVAETGRLKAEMARLLDETIRGYPEMPPGAWWLPASYGGSAPTPARAKELDSQELRSRAAARVAQRRQQVS